MNMWIIIPVLLVVFFVVLTLLQRRYPGSRTVHSENDQPYPRKGTLDFSMNDRDALSGEMPEGVWWKKVSGLQQLRLALYLVEKAMPVWENFTSTRMVSYRAASAGPLTIVETNLLQKTVEEIFLYVQSYDAGSDSLKINQYHHLFIGAVLALKDGLWVCSYPVKKIILSVHFILMSIVEQHTPNPKEDFLSEAISAALECMELSRLYAPEKIASFLDAYRRSL